MSGDDGKLIVKTGDVVMPKIDDLTAYNHGLVVVINGFAYLWNACEQHYVDCIGVGSAAVDRGARWRLATPEERTQFLLGLKQRSVGPPLSSKDRGNWDEFDQPRFDEHVKPILDTIQ